MNDGDDVSIKDAACVCCGERGHGTVDHLRPRCMDGEHAASNRQVLCYRCNHLKSTLEAQEVARYRRALRQGRGDQAERIVASYLEQWAGYCKRRKHGEWLRCRCAGCLAAPISFGQTAIQVFSAEVAR